MTLLCESQASAAASLAAEDGLCGRLGDDLFDRMDRESSSHDDDAAKPQADAQRVMQEGGIGKLPDEILIEVLRGLDGPTLHKVMGLSPRFERLGAREELWRKLCLGCAHTHAGLRYLSQVHFCLDERLRSLALPSR